MEIFKINKKVNQWWWPLVLGILMILFGIFLLVQPIPAFIGISIFFASVIFASGIINTIFSIVNRKIISGWVWYLLMGIFELVIGIAMFFQPHLALEFTILFTGFWLMFRSFLGISFALEMKKLGFKGWGWSMFWSVLTLIFSFLVLINPLIGMVSVVVLTAVPIIMMGIFAISLSLLLKKLIV